MAGKGRPGGNPDIAKYGFKRQVDWRGSCTERMTLRMPPEMKQAIRTGELDDWQELCRRAIALKLGWDIPDEESGNNDNASAE